MTTLFYLIIYDLPDNKAANKRRTRLHKMLSGYGKWTQYSVFECFLTAVQFAQLQTKIEKLIKSDEDSLRIVKVVSAYLIPARGLKPCGMFFRSRNGYQVSAYLIPARGLKPSSTCLLFSIFTTFPHI